MSKVAFLLVTCCLEPLRMRTLKSVVTNLRQQAPELLPVISVFDNASTEPGVTELLKENFSYVFQADHNVGYWTAISWWLNQLKPDPPDHVYIIESDMIHYNFHRFWSCVTYLDTHPDIGSVRLQRYSYVNRHMFNKDRPKRGAYINDWQTHMNNVTRQPIVFYDGNINGIIATSFLTKLPCLNRYKTMKEVFDELVKLRQFSEPDFQRLYWERYQKTAMLDGGIMHSDLTGYGVENVTGSWTDPLKLKELGYLPTREATIIGPHLYTITKLT